MRNMEKLKEQRQQPSFSLGTVNFTMLSCSKPIDFKAVAWAQHIEEHCFAQHMEATVGNIVH